VGGVTFINQIYTYTRSAISLTFHILNSQ